MNYKKLKLINYHINLSKEGISFRPFTDKNKNVGFNFYVYQDSEVRIFLQTSVIDEDTIDSFFIKISSNFIDNIKDCYNYIFESFQLFVWSKQKKQLVTIVDYLGVGSNYVLKGEDGTYVFFSNFLFLEKLGSQLKLSINNLYTYLLLGYQVKPMELPYKNVSSHQGSTIYNYSFNKCSINKIKVDSSELKIKKIATTIKNNYKVSSLNNKLFFGATAGKDSLALMSLINETDITFIAGNFGHVLSDDVIQGEKISSYLDLTYTYCKNVDGKEFQYYSNEIASISGGLSTCSYVDMLKFIDTTIPVDYTYVMGEAGECYRDFFENNKEISSSIEKYLTPSKFLEQCLHISKHKINNLKNKLFEDINTFYKGNSVSEILRDFYCNGRMPGNFSNRTKLINRYRNKSSPFLNLNLLRNISNLSDELFQNETIHRELIKSKKSNEWFIFFEEPFKSNFDSQNWDERIKGDIGKTIKNIIDNMSIVSENLINKKGLNKLLTDEIIKPSRGIYLILRIISIICFIDKNHKYIKLIN
jgi:hypothetical protein